MTGVLWFVFSTENQHVIKCGVNWIVNESVPENVINNTINLFFNCN